MIEVNLTLEEYNSLYNQCIGGFVFCTKQCDSIILVDNPDSQNVIATVKLNSPEGKILSYYTNCLLEGEVGEGKISLYNTCAGTIYDCDNCSFAPGRYFCDKGISKILDGLEYKIEDITFIDPIQGRNYKTVEYLKQCCGKIDLMRETFEKKSAPELQEVYKTIEILHSQIKNVVEKWDYYDISNEE